MKLTRRVSMQHGRCTSFLMFHLHHIKDPITMFFSRNKDEPTERVLDSPSDLLAGDIITLKPRSILPAELRGKDLTVKKVQAYQYSEGYMPEFVLTSPENMTFTLMVEPEEEGEDLTFSRLISPAEVQQLFDLDNFSELFGDTAAHLNVLDSDFTKVFDGWIAEKYFQSIQNGNGYFYDDDRRKQTPSKYVDDASEELRFHECEGNPDRYSLNVEIWEDGATDVFLQLTVPSNVIELMWPHGKA